MDRILLFIETAEFWHWFGFAALLLIIEVLAPSAIFIWLAAAAGMTGFVLLINAELAWQLQWTLFAFLSVFAVVGGRAYIRTRPPAATDQPTLNKRGEQYVGRTFTLDAPIVNRAGRLHVDDTTWKIEGNDMAAGTSVTVTGVHGVVLHVEDKAAG